MGSVNMSSLAFLGDDATQIVHGPREQFDLINMKIYFGEICFKVLITRIHNNGLF